MSHDSVCNIHHHILVQPNYSTFLLGFLQLNLVTIIERVLTCKLNIINGKYPSLTYYSFGVQIT